jgi:uncharacterized protein YuzE
VEISAEGIVGTRDLDENTLLELDSRGNVCAITFEHASDRTDVSKVVVEGMAA